MPNMPKEFIVAIELGSSKITGIAGQKNLDGSLSVLALVEEDSSACIRKGMVYNIEKTGQCLTNIITKLKNLLKQDIKQVYVGFCGQSVHSVKNNINQDFMTPTIVTDELIDRLKDANNDMVYPEMKIFEPINLEYKVDNQLQIDPVGIQCSHLEGNFLNIILRKNFHQNLVTCFDNANIIIADMYLSPLKLADAVLTDTEKRSGCVLVDLGAETTTVSVYYRNILRHLAVIPLGGNNITKDIASLQMEESDAEKMKLKYASAFTPIDKIDDSINYPIDSDRNVKSSDFIALVEDRMEEIIENVWYQVPGEYADKILGGIILTGGGSNMPNIVQAFHNYTNVEKIRVARFVNFTVKSKDPRITAHDGTLNTALAILASGDMNCAGDEITHDLFSSKPQNTAAPLRQETGTPTGGMTPLEKARLAEEEERKKRQAEAEKAEEERARLAAEKAQERKENSFWHKFGNKLKDFGSKIIGPEEE